ncbi:GNAT family N-acetyltransferase [Allostreptomyces psammosilenae]|uniref:GNAT superfamily N-acetyltransferase n=1 Tax=Allostreptomyces psammosilenae TaxID=1892865 RepID=A0A852ZWE4_9ACTN|nr:GNAT family N-acetyltransferase [Allostreptomyces psammosilenae]NYI06696.1 GNAT superfamily N-acetyltransferase [Allostreptomyces psammosilenae]
MTTALASRDEIFAVRHAVLRPGLPAETALYPEDELPEAFHVAARDSSGAVVGCVTFFPEALPEDLRAAAGAGLDAGGADPAAALGYRFRGMGTAPEVRGQGYGGRLLATATEEVLRRAAEGGSKAAVIWCNGRVSARGFYEHLGFRAVGEQFTIEPSGPHYVFVRVVPVG